MNRKFLLAGLVAILATSVTFVSSTYAQDDRQRSIQICSNPPNSNGGQQTLAAKPADVNGYRVRVELRSSNQSRTKWVRACVPRGTTLYLKDEFGKRYVPYITQVTGWNYGDKLNSTKRFQACADYPNVGELCTDFR
ncbi:hypothetical protein H6F98_25915 [Microcoleus sp. FACHB-SPT15]|uniref:hypothetical protein n=1 Tax=Microcoleus sp. FACHB-SPT15 TaxID=2692830 RepID=UPI001781444A|nr:hypothetical protein [Microcoleus sp. FACHB-SPT15]MBD1808865.1 hypothetical protein [Microcoleus sp. FACHB-SPT15]